MKLEQAEIIANKYVRLLGPYCKRIEIAGSIRRQCAEVGDIEIVCIRNTAKLFNFVGEVNKLKKIKGEATGKYTQRLLLEGINLDLFMCYKENWGLIYAIRTGSVGYSHTVLAEGWAKCGFKSADGMLQKDGLPVPVYEEKDLFDLIGVQFKPPEFRSM